MVSNDIRRLPTEVETDTKPTPDQREYNPSSCRRRKRLDNFLVSIRFLYTTIHIQVTREGHGWL